MFVLTAEEIVEDHGDGINFVVETFSTESLLKGIDRKDSAFLRLIKSSSGVIPDLFPESSSEVRMSREQNTYDFSISWTIVGGTIISLVFSGYEEKTTNEPNLLGEARIANKIVHNLNSALWDLDNLQSDRR